MISQELLDILRCPLDPSRTSLTLGNDRLVCQRCGVKYKIKDGLPILVAEDAELPAGCTSLEQLPCQREGREPKPE